MTPKPVIKAILFVLLIALSLVAIWLVNAAPDYFIDNNVVYQGF